MKRVLPPGQWAQQFNRTACAYQSLANVCSLTGKACEQWVNGEECNAYVNHNEAVKLSSIHPKLRELIREADGQMLFVEKGDPRFTERDLQEMANDVVLHNPKLSSYVDINWSEGADVIVTIYEGIGRVLV